VGMSCAREVIVDMARDAYHIPHQAATENYLWDSSTISLVVDM
jgi:hypothetical protein